ncbi:MAG: MFS transporter [Deltaproteobacteria bacterium]|nr:MFS transporter [Deltaproteobacteria bacterium]
MNWFQRLKQHPAGFKYVFFGELAERSSFYGMRTILALYMTQILGFKENNASLIMTWFIACCYLTPMLGGLIADRWLGRYKTILYFSGPYILGHLILGGWESPYALFSALALLALGSGSIKPNTSTLMGAMYEEQKKDALLNEAFSYYYAAINIGSAISTFGLPWVRGAVKTYSMAHGVPEHEALSRGFAVALIVPAALMALAFVFFAIGKKHYPKDNPAEAPAKTPEQRASERATLGRIAGVFGLLIIWWLVYDQSASTWIYFANNHMDLRLWGNTFITADAVQGVNPLMIVFLTPFFNWMWNAAKARRGGVDVPDTQKMFIGFIIVTVCMAIMAVSAYAVGDHKISVWWLILATLVVTMSELCVSVVGLEFAFKVAAPGTKSFVTACFFLTIFIGDFIGGLMDQALWGKISDGNFFLIQAVASGVITAAFWVVAKNFERNQAAVQASLAPPRQQVAST